MKPKREHLVEPKPAPKFDRGFTQKNCESCGKRAIKIDKDKFGMRTCSCGATWHPQKLKVQK